MIKFGILSLDCFGEVLIYIVGFVFIDCHVVKSSKIYAFKNTQINKNTNEQNQNGLKKNYLFISFHKQYNDFQVCISFESSNKSNENALVVF